MFRCIFLVMLLFISAAFSQVVTYIGYSEVSQKAAEEEAMAGVARQISSQVKSNVSVTISEQHRGENIETAKNASTSNQVKSDVFLKGVKLKKLSKKGNLFGAEATLDLMELTSEFRLKMGEIQKRIFELENRANAALKGRDYTKVIELLDEIRTVAEPYNYYLNGVLAYMPADDSMLLKNESEKIHDELLKALQSVKVTVVEHFAEIKKDFNKIVIQVEDEAGLLSNMNFFVEKAGKRLGGYASKNGNVEVDIPYKKLEEPPYTISVILDLPMAYKKSAGINDYTFDYSVKSTICEWRLECNEEGVVCAGISKKLSKVIKLTENENSTTLKVKTSVTEKSSLKNLTSYDVSLTLASENGRCDLTAVGAGKSKTDAVKKAIGKMKFNNCKNIFEQCVNGEN